MSSHFKSNAERNARFKPPYRCALCDKYLNNIQGNEVITFRKTENY